MHALFLSGKLRVAGEKFQAAIPAKAS